jgi:hypothetical protein
MPLEMDGRTDFCVLEVLDMGKHLSEKAKKDFKRTRFEPGESMCLGYNGAKRLKFHFSAEMRHYSGLRV